VPDVWFCPLCEQKYPADIVFPLHCSCRAVIGHRDGTILDYGTYCPARGDEVIRTIAPQDCGCGATKPVEVFHCSHHDCQTTVRKVPAFRHRAHRNCVECVTKGEHQKVRDIEETSESG